MHAKVYQSVDIPDDLDDQRTATIGRVKPLITRRLDRSHREIHIFGRGMWDRPAVLIGRIFTLRFVKQIRN